MKGKILEEQNSNDWPGLTTEIKDICMELNIPDQNKNDMPVSHMKHAIYNHHDKELVEEVSKSKKMMKHKGDDFSQVQEYMK